MILDELFEGKHFRTAYGWAGGYNEKTGKKYKHPEQARADREARKQQKSGKPEDQTHWNFGSAVVAEQGVAETENAEYRTKQVKVFKDRAGNPIGEIGIDLDASPGNDDWYCHHYATGYNVLGFENAAEARRELQYVHKHPEEVDESVNEGVNAKQIKKDLDSGMSYDAVIGKHANKRMTNTDEIRRVIQQHAWEKRMKRPKEQGVAEGSEQRFMIYFVVPDVEDYDDHHEPEERTIIVASNQSEAIKKFQAEIPGAYIKDIYPMEGQQGVSEAIPSHIKPSDLPPAMRNRRLTMRDIEAERPKGAYRYRVIPGTPDESPKDFLNLAGAEEHARAVGGRVQPLEEQVTDPDMQRGIENLDTLERNAGNNLPVEIQNETGRAEYQIEKSRDKQWVINHAKEWVDAGRGNDLYRYMGNTRGFEFLLASWQKEDSYRSAQSKRAKYEPDADTTPDLYGTQALGKPRAPRYQDESTHPQKKRVELGEAPQGARGRTERMMAQMRARQPQATSDLEAMAYELQDAERRDSEEIDKLEKEVDNLETDIKSDLQKRISTLTRRKSGIQQAVASDTKIDATLDQLAQVNDQQQRDINNLTKAVAGLGQRGSTAPISLAVDSGSTQAAQPATTPGIEVPPKYRSKEITPQTTDPYAGAITGLIGQMQKPTTVTPTDQEKDQEPSAGPTTDQPSGEEEKPENLPTGNLTQVGGVDPTQWKKVAEEQEQDLVDKLRGTALGRTVEPAMRRAGKAIGQTALGKKIGSEYGMAKSAMGALKGAMLNRRAPSPFDVDQSEWHKYGWAEPPEKPTAPIQAPVPEPAVTPTPAVAPAAAAPAASSIIQPVSYGGVRTARQQASMQDLVKQARALPPAQKAAAMPASWQPGQPIKIGKETITKNNPNYQKIVAALRQQSVTEKKKPVPTNPDLWGRAKSAARSKFDVYPSAYANAWAAKWYKSKGGGWRMGKPKKK